MATPDSYKPGGHNYQNEPQSRGQTRDHNPLKVLELFNQHICASRGKVDRQSTNVDCDLKPKEALKNRKLIIVSQNIDYV